MLRRWRPVAGERGRTKVLVPSVRRYGTMVLPLYFNPNEGMSTVMAVTVLSFCLPPTCVD